MHTLDSQSAYPDPEDNLMLPEQTLWLKIEIEEIYWITISIIIIILNPLVENVDCYKFSFKTFLYQRIFKDYSACFIVTIFASKLLDLQAEMYCMYLASL